MFRYTNSLAIDVKPEYEKVLEFKIVIKIYQMLTAGWGPCYIAPTNHPPRLVAATLTLHPNSYRLWALPLLMHSTAGSRWPLFFYLHQLLQNKP